MYTVIITHGAASIEFPTDDKNEAHTMYLKQVVHNSEECATLGDRCTIYLKHNLEIIAKTSIECSKRKG